MSTASVGRWWVEAEGRAWGPYPFQRLAGFCAEGRLGAGSLVARTREGPFTPAAQAPELEELFAPADVAGPESTEPSRPLLVFGDSEDADALEAALGAHGPLVRIRPGLWLVQARQAPASLRNVVSRRLRAGDTLLVVEAPLGAAAWFNLDGDTDRALRRLWSDPDAATA